MTVTASLDTRTAMTPRVGAAVAVAFVVMLASSNSITPLLPLFRAHHGLNDIGSAALFATYQLILAPMLWVFGSARLQRRAALLLPAGLALVIVGNLMLTAESLPLLFAGRAVTGVAVGLATGATATLAFAGLGERGRTVAATGNLVGALVGTSLATAAAQWADNPPALTAWTLSTAAAATLIVLLSSLGTKGLTRPLPAARSARSAATASTYGASYRAAGFALGSLAWVFIMLALVLVPARLSDLTGPTSALTAGAAALALLTTAAVSQFFIFRFPRALGAVAAACYLTIGCIALAIALNAGHVGLAIVAMAIGGVGNGVGYRRGLAMVTTGLDAVAHGARASLYVFTAYAVGVVGLLTLTVVGTWIGDGWMWCLCGIGSATIALFVIVASKRRAFSS